MIVTDGLIDNKSDSKSDYQKWFGKNIDKTSTGKFKVRKVINGKQYYFGTYDSFDEAVAVRDKLIESDWDKNIILTDEDKINQYYKYIKCNGDYYYEVNRPKNNKKGLPRYMGTCKSIEEALYYRDIARSNDYIIGKASEYDLITDNPYIKNGLKYPIPEKLKPRKNRQQSTYGKGYVTEKGPNSYQVWYNKKYYGSYTTQEFAEYIRLKLYENNWDKTKLPKIKKEYPEYYINTLHFWRHIYYDKETNKWICRKFLSKDNEIYFSFKNPEDTLHERDLYEKYDWDINKVVELAEPCENPYKNMELPAYPTRRVKINHDLNEEHYTNFIEDIAFFIREFNINSIPAMAETLDTTKYLINDALDKFNITWNDFIELAYSGEEISTVLTYDNIVTPDLKPVKSKSNYVYYAKSRKYSKWIIVKDKVFYGSYSTKKIALKVANHLKKVDWDKKQLDNIRESIGYKSCKTRGDTSKLIYEDKRTPNKTRYYIKKQVGGKSVWYGSYKNKKTAEKIVKELQKCNWNKEQLQLIKEKIGV